MTRLMSHCVVPTVAEHRRQAADHEHARGDHRCGVDQRRHGGRTFHRVGKPGVQAKLRRLAHRADEQQQTEHGHRVEAVAEETDRRSRHARRSGQNLGDRDGAEHQEGAEDTEHEAEVADAVDDERLDRCSIGARLLVPETDQQIGRQTNAFPAEEHLDEVVRGHEHQHREGEERQIGEEARLIRIFAHIAPAIEVDERRNGRNDDQHHRGQRVDAQLPVELERARRNPVQHRRDAGFARSRDEGQKNRPAQRAACKQRSGGHELRRGGADGALAQTCDKRREQRQENDRLNHRLTPSSGWHRRRRWCRGRGNR